MIPFSAADITRLLGRRSHLVSSSIYLMATTLVSSAVGFIFWVIAARLCSPEEVGLATALVSFLSLVVLVSRLGIDQSVVRFMPEGDRNKVFWTSLVAIVLLAGFAGFLSVVVASELSRDLALVRTHALATILFVIFASASTMIGVSFVALRRADFQFIQSLLIDARIILVVPLASYAAFGIFAAVGISYLLGLVVSIPLLRVLGIGRTEFDFDFLKKSSSFSVGSYASNILLMVPPLALPIMILGLVNASETAVYYISYSIASMLFVIPNAFSTSLFVEGSHGEKVSRNAVRASKASFMLLVPSIVGVFLLGEPLLNAIGPDYVEGIPLLRLLSISSVPLTVCAVSFSAMKILREIRLLVLFSAYLFISLIGLSYSFAALIGIEGIGYAWILAYSVGSLLALFWVSQRMPVSRLASRS